ncbi:MAG: hypothetical protein A2751_00745 [Candidatus Doudnabacteria bacterium RIFCSPHIGHO2_01_FULL_46_14]|uniref:Uncharacterized protein n=1 Tax=Candidatus Doudnabacteria bacterium RIFCSPHIGHO2_01_FULL_46_14 TaxID=1817824 RepID=A0A1F5NMQ9_9BACT|nr:MAG: hypothetical protein A2751_00745 [Candidatus Doudnabacteria bacterium RIFCSPHIGHO2_01_FULL_46_14]
MLKPNAFAASLAGLMAIFYIVFYVIAVVSPEMFRYLFNAQFMGADLAPINVQFNFGVLFTLVVTGWVVGYIWALLYNKLAR